MTGGQAILALLKAEQVRRIFGIVGSTLLDIPDANESPPPAGMARRRE